jgi:hypothetical protein
MTKETQAYKHAFAHFCSRPQIAQYWIYRDGVKLRKEDVFKENFVEPKDKHEDYVPEHQTNLQLVISHLTDKYTLKHRKGIDPNHVDLDINQEESEQERLLDVIKKKTTILLRDNGDNQMFFNDAKLRNTLETYMVWVFNNYKEIEKEVNHLPNK